MTNPLFFSLGNCWMDFLNVAGKGSLKSRLAKPNSSPLYGNSANCIVLEQGSALR